MSTKITKINVRLFLIVALFLMSSLDGNAQVSKGRIGFKAGLNISNVRGTLLLPPLYKSLDGETTKTLNGLYIGIDYDMPITKNFSIVPGVSFSQEGYSIEKESLKLENKFNIIDIPVAFNYTIDAKWFTIGGLLIPGILLGSDFAVEANGTKASVEMDEINNTFQFGLGLSLEFNLNKNITIGYRTKVGITNLYDDPDADFQTAVSTFFVAYRL